MSVPVTHSSSSQFGRSTKLHLGSWRLKTSKIRPGFKCPSPRFSRFQRRRTRVLTVITPSLTLSLTLHTVVHPSDYELLR